MPATIQLQLTSFVDITTNGGFCPATMSLNPNPSGRVSLVLGAGGKQVLHVKGGYADLDFEIVPPTGSGETYTALGIGFVGPASDPQGKRSFDLRNLHLDGPELGIRNRWGKHGPGISYEAYIWIQQDSDSAFGIIDPEIQNDN